MALSSMASGASSSAHQSQQPSSTQSGQLPVGHGRIIRDGEGNVIGVELGQEAHDEQEDSDVMQAPEISPAVVGKWVTDLGPRQENSRSDRDVVAGELIANPISSSLLALFTSSQAILFIAFSLNGRVFLNGRAPLCLSSIACLRLRTTLLAIASLLSASNNFTYWCDITFLLWCGTGSGRSRFLRLSCGQQ